MDLLVPNHFFNTMGTLSDITAQATNNIKRRSPSSIGYQVLQSPTGMDKKNTPKPKSPHFMTPTLSSAKQSVGTHPKSHSKPTPRSPPPAKGEGNSAWMKAAAKRVGFRRAGDGTPRSEKEGLAKQTSAISFPDKVCLTFPDIHSNMNFFDA